MQKDRQISKKAWSSIILSAFILIYIVQCYRYFSYTMDDAFITLRYAKHLAHGIGAVFNIVYQNPPVMGYTSFFWMIITALGEIVTKDIVIFSKILGIIFGIGCAVFVFLLSKNFSFGGQMIAFSFLLFPPFSLHAVSGMETIIAAFLNIVIIYLFYHQSKEFSSLRLFFIAPLFFVIPLTRPEMGLGSLIYILYLLMIERSRNIHLKKTILFISFLCIIPAVIYLLWIKSYYGDFLPLPFYIKQKWFFAIGGVKYVLSFVFLVILPLISFVILGLRKELKEKIYPVKLYRITLVYSLLIFIYFCTVQPTMGIFYRYLIPFFIPICMISAYYFDMLFPDKGRKYFLWGILGIFYMLPSHFLLTEYFVDSVGRCMIQLPAIGKSLAPLKSEKTWCAYGDAGTIPFYSDWNFIDLWGLNTDIRNEAIEKIFQNENIELVFFNINKLSKEFKIPSYCSEGYSVLTELPHLKEEGRRDLSILVLVNNKSERKEILKQAIESNWKGPVVIKPGFSSRLYQVGRIVLKGRKY
jgi:arabinofuranosyltransferase